MQVEIAARHGHLSQHHQDEIRRKAEKLLHYYARLTYITVTVDLAHPEAELELVCKSEHKHDFVAVASGHELMSVMCAAVEKVKVQIVHHKERTQDHRRDPSHAGPAGIRA